MRRTILSTTAVTKTIALWFLLPGPVLLRVQSLCPSIRHITTTRTTATSIRHCRRRPCHHHHSSLRMSSIPTHKDNNNNNNNKKSNIGETMNNTRTSISSNPDNDPDHVMTTMMMMGWKHSPYTVCPKCHGEGRFMQRSKASKHARRDVQKHDHISQQEHQSSAKSLQQQQQQQRFFYKPCQSCHGSGLEKSTLHNNTLTTNSTAVPSSLPSPSLPFVAIIGGGIGGLALGIAFWHRQIPFMIYERDETFLQRKQGYGLTLQQASKALNGFGDIMARRILPRTTIKKHSRSTTTNDDDCVGIISTRHVVHTSNGTVVGEWGLRKWGRKRRHINHTKNDDNDETNEEESTTTLSSSSSSPPPPKRQNVHVARQALRYQLLQALPTSLPSSAASAADLQSSQPSSSPFSFSSCVVQWNRQLVNMTETDDGVDLIFTSSNVNSTTNCKTEQNDSTKKETFKVTANIVVGADGIRSTVRNLLLGNDHHTGEGTTTTPLRYLGCIVILGICPLDQIKLPTQQHHEDEDDENTHIDLLDGHTVFQTADGTTRLYAMPYSKTEYMWQLSYPVEQEDDAKHMSRQGEQFLKDAAWNKCSTWHAPIPQILQATPKDLISGYPVYDRDLLKQNVLQTKSKRITLMGDAAHPMSPFKGQGANQALLDALSLARALYRHCGSTNRKRNTNDDTTVTSVDSIAAALERYHTEMLDRSATKVQASADAAQFLHSNIAIQKGNITRAAAAAAAAAASASTNTSIQ